MLDILVDLTDIKREYSIGCNDQLSEIWALRQLVASSAPTHAKIKFVLRGDNNEKMVKND